MQEWPFPTTGHWNLKHNESDTYPGGTTGNQGNRGICARVRVCWKARPASPSGQLRILQGKITRQNLVLHGRAVGSFRHLSWGKENWKVNRSYREKHVLGTQNKLFPSLKFIYWNFWAEIPIWWDLAFRLPISGLENCYRPGCKWFETGTKTIGWVN